MQQEDGRGDVRAVRVAQRQRLIQSIGAARFSNETGEFTRSAPHILLVEQTLAKAPEEARHSAFEHIPARGEERRPRRDLAAKRHEVGLVATGAMEKENRRQDWVGAGLEAVNIG